MKKIMVILLATVTLGLANKAEAQVHGGISFNTFYNELNPYGRWVDDLQYGQVWIADEQGFEPYYNNGHWVYTSYGWTWVSDYAWGWAPFHYGRWTYLSNWGWAWVPGYEWGPAWVGWCQNDGYYGWAPLSPGLGFNISYNSMPNNYWRFVEQRYITGPSIRNHIIRPERNRNQFRNITIINNTQVNNNITYVAGPNRESVERVTRQKIATRPIAFNGSDERTRVEKKEVRMYRPDLKPANGAAINNRQPDQRSNELQQVRQTKTGTANNVAVKPLPNSSTSPANTVQPAVKQPDEQRINRADDRSVKPLPSSPKQDNQTAMGEPAFTRLPNERDIRRQPVQKGDELKTAPQNAQRQDELRQQRVQEQQRKEQQIQAQREQQQQTLQQRNEQQRQNELKQQTTQPQGPQQKQQPQEQKIQQQQAMQQQNEQRQNEIRQQQVREQREQQQRNLQQQNQQRENEIRQQQLQEQRAQQQRTAQQQNQQRQNEVRQQQLQEQRAQQQRMMQQQNQQHQNEIRQQRVQEATVRQQKQLPMNQKPPSRKPNEKQEGNF